MIDSLVNSIAGEVFTPEGITHPSMNMPHAQMVSNAYGYKTRTWVELTQEELSEIYNRTEWDTVNGWEYERAIEAKLRSKNGY